MMIILCHGSSRWWGMFTTSNSSRFVVVPTFAALFSSWIFINFQRHDFSSDDMRWSWRLRHEWIFSQKMFGQHHWGAPHGMAERIYVNAPGRWTVLFSEPAFERRGPNGKILAIPSFHMCVCVTFLRHFFYIIHSRLGNSSKISINNSTWFNFMTDVSISMLVNDITK